MKKIVALVLALMISLTAVAVFAESVIPVELVTMEDGLEFAIPNDWEYTEITEELAAQGIAVQAIDATNNRLFMLIMAQQESYVEVAALAESMAADTASYANAAAVTNEYGMEVVLFESADNTVAGFTFIDTEGMQYIFSYAHADASVITEDADLAALVSEVINTIGYVEVE